MENAPLSRDKQEKLSTFTAIAGCNAVVARQFLEACSWNCEVAVNRFFTNPDPTQFVENHDLSNEERDALSLSMYGMTQAEMNQQKQALKTFEEIKPKKDLTQSCPSNCLTLIACMLDVSDFLAFSQVCQRFCALTRSSNDMNANECARLLNKFWYVSCARLCSDKILHHYEERYTWILIFKDLVSIMLPRAREGKISLLRPRVPVSLQARESLPPLLQACRSDCVHLARLLLDRRDESIASDGVDADHNSLTPLFVAAREASINVVQELLSRPETKISAKCTAAHSSALLGTLLAVEGVAGKVKKELLLEIADMLVRHEAVTAQELNYVDKQGNNALIVACKQNYANLIKVMLGRFENGIDVNVTDGEGKTALMHALALARGGEELVMLLVKNGASVKDVVLEDGATPLLMAAKSGRLDAFRMFLELGSDLFAKDGKGMTAFSWAARGGHKKVFMFIYDYMLDEKFDSDEIEKYMNEAEKEKGRTAYILACKYSDGVTISKLADYCHVDITKRDFDKKTGSGHVFYSGSLKKRLKEKEQNYVPHKHERPPPEEETEDTQDTQETQDTVVTDKVNDEDAAEKAKRSD